MTAESSPRRFAKLFTVEEANALLPQFRRLFEEMRRLQAVIVRITQSKSHLSAGDGRAVVDLADLARDLKMVESSAVGIRRALESIAAAGAEVKDLDEGLVDFPHLREGKVVYLCWKFGEERIGYWHELDTGYAGRRPL